MLSSFLVDREVFYNMYDSLVAIDKDLKIVPALADVLIAAGKPAEARELLAALLAESAPVLPENSPRLADLRERIGKFERISLSHLP